MNFSLTLQQAKELFLLPCSIANGNKTNVDILNYVHLKIEKSCATVFGTDGLSIIKKQIDVIETPDFEICIEAKKLSASLHGYSDNDKKVTFNFKADKKVEIKYHRSKINIATNLAENYPVPIINQPEQYQFTCSANELKTGIANVQYARSKLDVRRALNHINFSIINDKMNLHATNGHRLVKTTVTVKESLSDIEGILPSGLVELILSLQPETDCHFFFDESNFSCVVDNITIASKFVAEKYLDVTSLLNPPILNSSTFKTSELLQSVNRVKLFLSGEKLPKLNLTLDGKDLKVNADAGTGNEIDDFIEAQATQCEAVSMSVNPSYLIDALKHIHTDDVCVSFTSKNMLKITDPNNSAFDAVIMAMR